MNSTNNKGFTLIEMMVAVAIMAIVATIAAPSFVNMIRNHRLTTAANDVLSAMQLARSEAIRQRRPITVCAGADACTDSADWSGGWIVTSPDTVIRVWSERPNMTINGPATNVTFSPDGRAETAAINLSIDDEFSRSVSITVTGRASVEH
jgi:type IV fimbrial biogenesis protein FimT